MIKTMTLDLLEKIFTDIHTKLTINEVTDKAYLFLKCAKNIKADLQDDYWIELSKEWDLNIIQGEGTTGFQMCLYKVKRDKNGNFVTDTLDQFISI